MEKVTATFAQLMDQAPKTVGDYMIKAIQEIDRVMGKGYAQNHPELLTAFISAAAADFNSSVLVQTLQHATETINESIQELIAALNAR